MHRVIKRHENTETGEVKILMLNAEHFGAGLNLQMTTDIIIYHKFRNDNLRTQVIGRAQRPGRSNTLNVKYLKYDCE